MKRAAMCISAALLLVACSKPTDAVIPTSKEDHNQFVEKVISKLDEEDKKLYGAWLMRRGLAAAFTNSELVPPGTTVAQAIAEQREWIAKQEAAKAEELRLQKEREAAKAGLQDLMAKSLNIQYGGHELIPKNYQANRYSEQQKIYLRVTNNGAKDIKGVQATLKYSDMFGNPIDSINFQVTDAIATGHGIEWIGHRDLNQFSDSDKKLMSLSADQYTVDIHVRTIIFSDGTKLESL